MALPIRSPNWPPVPAQGQTPVQPGRNDARVAAQKAFFEAALAGKVAPEMQAPDVGAASGSAQPRPASAAPNAPEGDPIPRPGSIIDIWV